MKRGLWRPRRRRRRRDLEAYDDEHDEPPRKRPRRWAEYVGQRLGAAITGVLLAVVCAELALRVPFLPIPRDLGTHLFQCYGPEYEGARVMFWSDQLGISLLKPSFEASCAWNGYRWTHRTDRWGFRNPETWDQADVVLLGDSMIYGHGVEEHQTVARFLRDQLHVRVANLAFMGDSLPEELAVLNNFGLPLKPKVALLFVFHNDLEDIVHTKKEGDIRRFIATGEAPEARVVPRTRLLAEAPAPGGSPSPVAWLAHEFLTYRTLAYYLSARSNDHVAGPRTIEARPPLPNLPVAPPEPTPAEALAIQYVHTAIGLMKKTTEQAGVRLVVVYLPGLIDQDGRVDRLLYHHLSTIAADERLPFLDATPVMADASGAPIADTRLEYDGHLSEKGHLRLAEHVAAFIRQRGLLAPQ